MSAFGAKFKREVHVQHPRRSDAALCGRIGVKTTTPELFKLSGNAKWRTCEACAEKLKADKAVRS